VAKRRQGCASAQPRKRWAVATAWVRAILRFSLPVAQAWGGLRIWRNHRSTNARPRSNEKCHISQASFDRFLEIPVADMAPLVADTASRVAGMSPLASREAASVPAREVSVKRTTNAAPRHQVVLRPSGQVLPPLAPRGKTLAPPRRSIILCGTVWHESATTEIGSVGSTLADRTKSRTSTKTTTHFPRLSEQYDLRDAYR